jgi:hypothetical protein
MPDQWKRGVSFRILLHIDHVGDFTGAPELDGGEPITDFRPASHSLPRCHLGTVDGMPVNSDSGSIMPAPIPALGDMGPAFARRSGQDVRQELELPSRRKDRGTRTPSHPRDEERHLSRCSPSRGSARHRSRSVAKEGKGRRAHHNSRCDDRDSRKRHCRDDDDEDERRGPRRDQ